jgi:glycosyltransferase involved in cell wall biosynthesis
MPRVLVVAHEPVGPRMAGPAVRSRELARALAADCEVTLAAPPGSDPGDPRVRLVEAGFEDYATLARAIAGSDVVVAQALPTRLLGQVARLGARLVADLYAPTPIEALDFVADQPPARARTTTALALRRTVALAAAADLIVCASERQRDMWLGGLALRGLVDLGDYRRDPRPDRFVAVVPFGCPERPPRADGPAIKGVWPGIEPRDRVLLWGGGVWNWLDPMTAIVAVERLRDLDPPVHLVFLGLARPALDRDGEMGAPARALALARERGLDGSRVHFNRGWTAYDERERYLLDADVGVSAHPDSLESRFAFRTRMLDYLWAGLPVVCTRGDTLSDLVERERLGAAVAPGDAAAFAAACRSVLADPAPARAAIARVRPDLSWERAARPLVEYCTSLPPPLAARRRAVAASTLAQYPAMARETAARDGAGALAGRLLRNLRRALVEAVDDRF